MSKNEIRLELLIRITTLLVILSFGFILLNHIISLTILSIFVLGKMIVAFMIWKRDLSLMQDR